MADASNIFGELRGRLGAAAALKAAAQEMKAIGGRTPRGGQAGVGAGCERHLTISIIIPCGSLHNSVMNG